METQLDRQVQSICTALMWFREMAAVAGKVSEYGFQGLFWDDSEDS